MTTNLPARIPLPAPLVPPDADLRHFPAMYLDIISLQNSETWALADGWQAKACMNLWMRAWHQVPAGSIPKDERILASWAGVPDWQHVREIALRGFVECSDGRLYHRTICEQVIKAMGLSERRADVANSRWNKKKLAPASLMHREEKRGEEDSIKDQPGLDLPPSPNAWPANYQVMFWNEYPRKIAKAAAMRALDKFHNRVPWDLIMTKLRAYKRWLGEGGGKVFRPEAKHPATWINGECWNDDYGEAERLALAAPVTEAALDRAGWERVARIYISTNQWPGPGPAPGQPGCVAPADLFRAPPRPGPGG